MSGLIIRLINPTDAVCIGSPEMESRIAPFTYSPLDSYRGDRLESLKSRHLVRDASKKDAKKSAPIKKAVC